MFSERCFLYMLLSYYEGIMEVEKAKRIVNIFHNPITAWVVLFISIILTLAAYFVSDKIVVERAEKEFEFRVNEISKAVTDRLTVYEQVLWGGVAYIKASETFPKRSEWKTYVDQLKLKTYWPGIQGVGFSLLVEPKDVSRIETSVQAEGFKEFKIWPNGTRDLFTTILYLEPFDWRNRRAFGYDMWSNEARRVAMARAKEFGIASMSGIITLVQETEQDVQRGFLTYVPVYKGNRKDVLGWVYAPFRANDLMSGILGSDDPNIEFEIFDGTAMSEETLLFKTTDQTHLKNTQFQPVFSVSKKLELQGRTWSLYFHTPKTFKIKGENQPKAVVMIGLIIDLLLFYIIYSLSVIQQRAEKLAVEMTTSLRTENEELNSKCDAQAFEIDQLKMKLSKDSS